MLRLDIIRGRVKSDVSRVMGVSQFIEVGRKANRSLGGLISGLGGPLGVFSDLLEAALHNNFCVYTDWASKG